MFFLCDCLGVPNCWTDWGSILGEGTTTLRKENTYIPPQNIFSFKN